MSSLLWHTIVDMQANLFAITDDDYSDHYGRSQYAWSYQMRHTHFHWDKAGYVALWPSARNMTGDVDQSAFMLGQANTDGATPFEPSSVIDGGTWYPWMLTGYCKDSNGNIIGGVHVDAYLASTDAFVADGTSNAQGLYQIPTPFNGQNHFMYGNYASGTLIGTTTNTLQPTR